MWLRGFYPLNELIIMNGEIKLNNMDSINKYMKELIESGKMIPNRDVDGGLSDSLLRVSKKEIMLSFVCNVFRHVIKCNSA